MKNLLKVSLLNRDFFMRALIAKLKGPSHFDRYNEGFAKNHIRQNEGQLYFTTFLNMNILIY